MVIRSVMALAFYCPRCGQLDMHELSRFSCRSEAGKELRCSCGQYQGKLVSAFRGQYLLEVPCALCRTNHIICLHGNQSSMPGVNKIYCSGDHIELGFVGSREAVAAAIEEHQQEFSRLLADMERESNICNPQVMIEILNQLHELAEDGKMRCRCGSTAVQAEMMPDSVKLSCRQCGGTLTVPAVSDDDLAAMRSIQMLELVSSRRSRRRH